MMMTQNIHILRSTDTWVTSVCDMIEGQAARSIAARGRFLLCLSGGSTPAIIYQRLASKPYLHSIDWKKVHFFWGDERCVPADHKDSNFGQAKESLLNHVDALPVHIHAIDGTLEPTKAASEYSTILQSLMPDVENSFDLVLLGLGEDGHTASLFPETPILRSGKKWADSVFVEKLDAHRISLTTEAINKARSVAFLVQGKNKSHILQQVLQDNKERPFPAQLVQPHSGDLHWWADVEAAAGIMK